MALSRYITPAVLARRDRRRKWVDRLSKLLLYAFALIVLYPLFSVLFYIAQKALPALDWSFFTEIPKPVGETGGGMANALAGSAKLLGLASLLGIPWGIGVGMFLSEYSSSPWAKGIRFVCNLLTSVPSIVIGLFVYALVVVPMKTFSAYAGALALAFIMIPIVARSSEEILKLVPLHVREAGLALGISRWRVTMFIVLRGARGGLITSVMLAIARVSGETAPLLFTALNNSFWSSSLREPTASLPVQIYAYSISPFEEWQQQAWVGAFVLVLLILVINLLTRFVFGRSLGHGKSS